jgi:hypothetical protein
MDEPEIDTDKIDEAVLALMYLTLHDGDPAFGTARAWKSFDWEAMSRLCEKDLIWDPVGKAKSVVLTKQGVERSKALFHALFAKRAQPGPGEAAGVTRGRLLVQDALQPRAHWGIRR